MSLIEQINDYFADQFPAKKEDLQQIHHRILTISPNAELWFLDGKNSDGKIVSNPHVGYGSVALRYANGDTKNFYKIGLSANTSGLSIYIMGLKDKKYLAETYGSRLGKAKITGYCISFKSLKDIDLSVLDEVIGNAVGPGSIGTLS